MLLFLQFTAYLYFLIKEVITKFHNLYNLLQQVKVSYHRTNSRDLMLSEIKLSYWYSFVIEQKERKKKPSHAYTCFPKQPLYFQQWLDLAELKENTSKNSVSQSR